MLKDMVAIHYQKWKAEMMKIDISNSYKNKVQKFLMIVINLTVKTQGFNINKFYGRMELFTSVSDIKKEIDFYTLRDLKQLYEEQRQFAKFNEEWLIFRNFILITFHQKKA